MVIFDWRARTLGLRDGIAFSFDEARLEIEPTPRGHVVRARGPGQLQCAIGFFPDEPVARAFRDRIDVMLRTKSDDPAGE